jgi:hypothetical protein
MRLSKQEYIVWLEEDAVSVGKGRRNKEEKKSVCQWRKNRQPWEKGVQM